MKHSDRLTIAGWLGLVAGMAMLALGAGAGEVASLVRGYGLLLLVSAVWLLGGLAVRSLVERRPAAQPRRSSLTARRAR